MVNNLSVPALCVAGVKNLDHPSLSKQRNPNTGALLLQNEEPNTKTFPLPSSVHFLSNSRHFQTVLPLGPFQIQKTIKKTARREQLMREEAEQKRLKTVLELQFILEKLGDDEVRSDLKQGSSGVPVLTEEELTMLDEFYKLVYPERDMNMR